MIRSVLVPVDGSNFAEHALPAALGIVRRTGATLHLALVHVPAEMVPSAHPMTEALESHHRELRDQDARYLEELAERLEAAGVPSRSKLLHGRVTTALESYVEAEAIDLVVMTTHGRGGLQRAWLGSTADSLIRHTALPVLLVRPSESTRELRLDSEPRFERVLAALDGSETAEVALQDALRLGITSGAEVDLFHVLRPAVAPATPYLPEGVPLPAEEMEARESGMRHYLETLAEGDLLSGWSSRLRLVTHARPALAILERAEELDADLIVMGTHGRSGLRRLLLGSVADKVIRGTDRPVLVHRGERRLGS